MPRFHLYVPDPVADEIRRRAEARGMSTSRFLEEIVARELESGWPPGFFEDTLGSWLGDSLERPTQPQLETLLADVHGSNLHAEEDTGSPQGRETW